MTGDPEGAGRPREDDSNPPVDPLAAFRLDGRTAIVTGASSGLGARFAQVLDAAGASVALVARRLDRLHDLAAGMRDALALRADLTEPAERDRVVPAVVERFGAVDILVNNAGRSTPVRALDETVEQFERTLAVNLVAPFALAQQTARSMVELGVRGGTILNVASVYGVTGIGRIPEAAYSASKGGIVALTRELASQWSRKGIRVNALAPGWFPSEMTEELFARADLAEWVRTRTPLGREGAPHELDGALLFLCSAASSYVTGQILCVDGGFTAV